MAKEWNYKNHRMLVPGYHFALSAILLIHFIYRGWELFSAPSLEHGVELLVAVALLLMFWYLRIFPLRAQDRVIRLEMQLRLRQILPEDLQNRLGELRPGQIVGLRFASDAELPDLVREALDQGLSGDEIKKRIKDWQGDDWRL